MSPKPRSCVLLADSSGTHGRARSTLQDTAPQPTSPPSRPRVSPLSRPVLPAAPVAPRHLSRAIWAPARLQVAWVAWVAWVAPKAPCSLRARLVEVSDEAAETVARDELLALELGARRGRGVVGLEPLLDGAALVRMAVYLFRVRECRVR